MAFQLEVVCQAMGRFLIAEPLLLSSVRSAFLTSCMWLQFNCSLYFLFAGSQMELSQVLSEGRLPMSKNLSASLPF